MKPYEETVQLRFLEIEDTIGKKLLRSSGSVLLNSGWHVRITGKTF